MSNAVSIPDLDDDENAELNAALAVIAEKRNFNALMQRRYDAEHAFRSVFDSVVPPKYHRLGLILGWCGKAVDSLAARTALDTFVWSEGGDLDSLGFNEIWDDNDIDSESFQAATSTLISGTSFVAAAQPDDDTVTVHFYGADVASGIWNPVTRDLDNLVVIAERGQNGEPTAMTIYLDGRTITAISDGVTWESDTAEHKYGMPAARMPYRPRLGRPFGRTRISRPVRALQDAAVRELVRLEGHMDIYSFPEFWMLGADESIFKDENGQVQNKWQTMLGRIKGIPDDEDATQPRADVKQFSASAPDPHLAAINAYAKLFARETGMPDSSVAITDLSNPTSADSYDASQYELIAEAERTTRGWLSPQRRVMRAALAMKNNENGIPASFGTIEPRFRDPRYLSRAQQADAGSKQLAAIPWLANTDIGLELMGLDSQQIQRALGQQQRAQSQQTLQALAALAASRGGTPATAPTPAPTPPAEQ